MSSKCDYISIISNLFQLDPLAKDNVDKGKFVIKNHLAKG